MRAKMLVLLVLSALLAASCAQATPPRYANSPEGAARRLLDAWQAYDPDLYLDAVLPSERQYVSVFSTNEFVQWLGSLAGNQKLPERPRLKFRALSFETKVDDDGRAAVAVSGYWRELNLAMELPFAATIVARQEGGLWLCAASETTISIPLLNPATATRTITQSLLEQGETVLGAIIKRGELLANSVDWPANDLPADEFRGHAREAIRRATAFRVDIVDYTQGKATRSVFWQRDGDWRWRLPNGEFRATSQRMCWQLYGATGWECGEAWYSRFRALPLLALAATDFSGIEKGEWSTYSPHTAQSDVKTINEVSCRVFAMQSPRDREECCFDVATYRPIQCSYTLDGSLLVANYKDWNIIVDWEFPGR